MSYRKKWAVRGGQVTGETGGEQGTMVVSAVVIVPRQMWDPRENVSPHPCLPSPKGQLFQLCPHLQKSAVCPNNLLEICQRKRSGGECFDVPHCPWLRGVWSGEVRDPSQGRVLTRTPALPGYPRAPPPPCCLPHPHRSPLPNSFPGLWRHLTHQEL